jgi:thiosulfate reductase cytochrome b subunit
MATQTVAVETPNRSQTTGVRYEHPYIVRLCHWVNTIALFVMAGSGLQIFRAFPSFGAKIPQKDLLHWPKAFAIGGWLGGALQWHLTFAWIYIGTGLLYLGYQLFSGNYKQVLFVRRDVPGVWPMMRHYFLFGPKPAQTETYNSLQKHAYTSVIFLGVLSVITGVAIWKPVQFSWLASAMGGFHWARLWHFVILWAMLAFVAGHLIMVALHGWDNFLSMITGTKSEALASPDLRTSELDEPTPAVATDSAEPVNEPSDITQSEKTQAGS